MIPKVSIILLVALNVYLLVCVSFTGSSLRSVEEEQVAQREALQRERDYRALDQTRLKAHLGELTRSVDDLRRQLIAGTRKPQAPGDQKVQTTGQEEKERNEEAEFVEKGYGQFEATLARLGLEERPEPEKIALMTEAEKAELAARVSELPKLDDEYLRSRDVYGLLKDPSWNPNERELNEEELTELRGLINDFTYYAKYAQTERMWKYVLPEIPKLREDGAYIEYPQDAAPPPMEGAVYSHAEPSDLEGYLRLYYFHGEDYPDIRHHRQVEIEQSRRIYVDVYELINGG